MKRIARILFHGLLILCLLVSAAAAESTISIAEIQKYGNLILTLSGSEFLRQGYTYGDLITVRINDVPYDMPVGTSYSDVAEGSMICRVIVDPASGEDAVILAINMGDLASFCRLAVKTAVNEEPGYRWDMLAREPVRISFSMREAGGYLNEFMLRQLVRTNERADYPALTDEQFANFRVVSTTGMGENLLYRSSSPVNPELGRNRYADAALANAGVRTVINLADSREQMQSYDGFDLSAYANCSVIALNLGVDFSAESFQTGLAQGLRFLISGEDPWLVHCTEGKDRAGFVSALLECFMGASAAEVLEDYMITYENYYGVEPGTEKHEIIAQSNIAQSLADAFEIPQLEGADLAAEAEQYLLDQLKLTPEEILTLREKLGGR